ncbi:MAG TPA: oxidoreductase, partial [Mycobacterium sp.]|nr:oxidoreductase [Mycobacterium sp.]
MQRFPLGPRSVGRLGFGAIQLCGPGVFGPPRDHDQALAVLRRAVDLGVDHIDTAQFYGPDVVNDLIREALYPYPENLTLVSKVGARRDEKGRWLPAHEPNELRRGIEENLRALRVQQLAAVNLRVIDPDAPNPNKPGSLRREQFDAQLTAMIRARDAGLVAGIGLSNVTLEHLRAALERTEIVCVQNAFNLTDRSSQAVLNECTARGIAFVPFFPLGSAFAAGNPVLGNSVVQRTAEKLSRTPAQIVLAWTLSLAPNILLIPGTS